MPNVEKYRERSPIESTKAEGRVALKESHRDGGTHEGSGLDRGSDLFADVSGFHDSSLAPSVRDQIRQGSVGEQESRKLLEMEDALRLAGMDERFGQALLASPHAFSELFEFESEEIEALVAASTAATVEQALVTLRRRFGSDDSAQKADS